MRPKRVLKPPQNLKGYIVGVFDEACSRSGITVSSDSPVKQIPNKKTEWHQNYVFHCKKCNFKSKTRKDLDSHFKVHINKENNFLCDECGIPLSSFQAFCEHMNIHKNVKPYVCETCGRESRQLSVHTRHLLVHEQNPGQMFKCSVCTKSFKQKEYLKQHMRKHVGEKPYECNKCSKSFTARTELNRHKISHSSARPFSCEYCSKRFKLKHNLRAHIRSHSGKQLWKCCLCKASFPQQSLMEKHKKSHKEVVQHVELVKNDQRTLSITSFPLDRRKVLHHQKISLPQKLDLNDCDNAVNSTVSLGLNNALIPISVIASSFGSGDYIKMKIIDQINIDTKNGSEMLRNMNGITDAVLVNEESPVPESDTDNLPQEKNTEQSNTDLSDIANGRSFETQFCNHFDEFQKIFSDEDNLSADMISWAETMAHIMCDCQLPLEKDISKKLHLVVVKVQTILISNCSEESDESASALRGPSYNSCHIEDKVQNDFVVESGEDRMSNNDNLETTKPRLKTTESHIKIMKEFEEKQIDNRQFKKEIFRKMVACYKTLSNILQDHLEAVINII